MYTAGCHGQSGATYTAGVKGQMYWQVSFVNTMGILEAGLDHGGLVKEFLEEVRSTAPGLE